MTVVFRTGDIDKAKWMRSIESVDRLQKLEALPPPELETELAGKYS